MPVIKKIVKSGNSLCIRFTKEDIDVYGFEKNDFIEFELGSIYKERDIVSFRKRFKKTPLAKDLLSFLVYNGFDLNTLGFFKKITLTALLFFRPIVQALKKALSQLSNGGLGDTAIFPALKF